LVPILGGSILHRPGIQAKVSAEGQTMAKTPPAVRRVQRSLAGVVLAVPAGLAQAQATVFRFEVIQTSTFDAPLEGCLPEDLVGSRKES
jgi:hypothetical protein